MTGSGLGNVLSWLFFFLVVTCLSCRKLWVRCGFPMRPPSLILTSSKRRTPNVWCDGACPAPLRQKDYHELKTNLGYIVRPHFKNKHPPPINNKYKERHQVLSTAQGTPSKQEACVVLVWSSGACHSCGLGASHFRVCTTAKGDSTMKEFYCMFFGLNRISWEMVHKHCIRRKVPPGSVRQWQDMEPAPD